MFSYNLRLLGVTNESRDMPITTALCDAVEVITPDEDGNTGAVARSLDVI